MIRATPSQLKAVEEIFYVSKLPLSKKKKRKILKLPKNTEKNYEVTRSREKNYSKKTFQKINQSACIN